MARKITQVLLVPFALSLLLVGLYTAAMHAPAPHRMNVAVAGPQAHTAPLAASLRKAVGDAYDITTVTTSARARQLVEDRTVAAAYVPSPSPGDRAAGTASTAFAQPPQPSGPVLYVASAAGPTGVTTAAAPFTNTAVQQHQFLQVRDLVPLSPHDTSGTTTMYVAIGLTLSGYMSVVILTTAFGAALTRRRAVAALAAFAAVTTLAIWAIAGPVLGALHGSAPAIWVTGWLTVMAVGMGTLLLSRFCGRLTTLPAVGIFMFLAMPASGAAVPVDTIPEPFRALHDIVPLTSTFGSLRQIMYFGGDNIARYWLALVLWALAGLTLTTAYDTFKARRTARRAETAPHLTPLPRPTASSASH
ncbi:ABC transporter permease [Streptomyces noursei]|uniref:ABC transporter permease n=1 Tax=Streptomyces noursei TaxID=1971 RepID=UPI0038055756